jgi:hypothetical protein
MPYNNEFGPTIYHRLDAHSLPRTWYTFSEQAIEGIRITTGYCVKDKNVMVESNHSEIVSNGLSR